MGDVAVVVAVAAVGKEAALSPHAKPLAKVEAAATGVTAALAAQLL